MRVVVSLSTIPGREALVQRTIASISKQTYPPDEIYLWLPRGRRFRAFQQKTMPSVTIRTWNDLGPATKLLPTLTKEADPGTLIITVDDDVEYPNTLVDKLVQAALLYPNCAIGFTGWVYGNQGHDPCVRHFNDQFAQCGIFHAVQVIEGTRGVLYRRGFFQDDVFHHLNSLDAFRYHDDIFFSGYLASKGVTRLVRWFDGQMPRLYNPWKIGGQDNGLHTTPGWYQLGKICWHYWRDAFIAETLSNGKINGVGRLQLNADEFRREGFFHHFREGGAHARRSDFVADLCAFPWPWRSQRFREVLAVAGVPTDDSFCQWLIECARIATKPGVVMLELSVPTEGCLRKVWTSPGIRRLEDLCKCEDSNGAGDEVVRIDSGFMKLPVAIEVNGNRISVLLALRENCNPPSVSAISDMHSR